jgi:DNA polymerase III delta subunit
VGGSQKMNNFQKDVKNLWTTDDRSNRFFSDDLISKLETASRNDLAERIELLNKLYKEVNRREKIYLLAHEALLDNRALADKTIANEYPAGYCPPEKRRKLIDAFEQILELVK